MKKTLALVACLLLLAISPASACWMFVPIEQMEEQAGIIVIGKLIGETREVKRQDGTGVTYWTLSIEHLLRGDAEETMEVATGGLVSQDGKKNVVMLSTDYRLDSYGGLFLLYLSDDSNDGSYWPITPRGIISLEHSEGGAVLGAYEIVSTQHEDEHDEILASISRLAVEVRPISESVVAKDLPKSDPSKSVVPLVAALTGTVSLAVIAIRRK